MKLAALLDIFIDKDIYVDGFQNFKYPSELIKAGVKSSSSSLEDEDDELLPPEDDDELLPLEDCSLDDELPELDSLVEVEELVSLESIDDSLLEILAKEHPDIANR